MIRGFLEVKEYVFTEPTRCIIGRAEDCDIQLPSSHGHVDVSRHHCMLEIGPSSVRVRDLGSRNGTFVNGEMIGQRPKNQPLEEANLSEFASVELKDGDELRVGHIATFLVSIGVPAEVEEHAPVPMYFV
jgi:pSer/pThr/pTyr-binding forkhead associated (FHA) protein